MRVLNAIDFFAGAGGFSHGVESSGVATVRLAINHWPVAIETHKLNHPHCTHALKDFACVSPTEVGRIDLLLASPPCQGHSLGRGSKPTTEQARTDAWDLLRWYAEKRIPEGIIENVPRFRKWGPVDEITGRPIKGQEGKYFDAWVMAIKALGHQVEYRILDCADFGAATSRPRLIVRTRYGKRAPVWPEPTHAGSHLPAVIDLSIPGRKIGGHLAAKTLARIARGRELFGDKFLIEYYGSSTAVSVDRPLPTITTRDRHGLVVGNTLRMLRNHELKASQGFAESYQFCGTAREITMQIGNSVSPPLARAFALAIAQ